jgi:uncharacterized repeat protein (TIGR03803 family)
MAMKKNSLCLLFLPFLSIFSLAQTYKFSTLYSFQNNGKDPSGPTSLILGADGNLYGTSELGGTYNAGTVFKMTTKGVLTVLHSFNGTTGGGNPTSLARYSRTGDIYGTTGTTVFKLTLKNSTFTFSTLYSNNLYAQMGAAVLDSHGNLYGTAYLCTSSTCVWEIPAGATWMDVWDAGDVENFISNIVIDKNGYLYVGEAYGGIAFSAWVQEIGGSGSSFGPSGEWPISLREDSSGEIYALAQGDFSDDGTNGEIFKTDTVGNVSILYTFVGGSQPSGSFSLDSTGNIFGTAYGTNGFVFKVKPTGILTSLYAGAVNANVGVVMDESGNLYGTTTTGLGSVFKLTK